MYQSETQQWEAERFDELFQETVSGDLPRVWDGRPYRLQNRRWAVWVQAPEGTGPKVGDTVQVTTRRGKSWLATVERIEDRITGGGKTATVVTTS